VLKLLTRLTYPLLSRHYICSSSYISYSLWWRVEAGRLL